MTRTTTQRTERREQRDLSAPMPLPARSPDDSRLKINTSEASLTPLSSATILSALIPAEDIRQILTRTHRTLEGIAYDLERSTRTTREAIRRYDHSERLTEQKKRNDSVLAVTQKHPDKLTLGDYMILSESTNQSLALLTSTLLTFGRRIASQQIWEDLSLKSRFSGLAPILSTLRRTIHGLKNTPKELVSSAQQEMFGDNLQILTTAYAEGLPQSPGWRRWCDMRAIRQTIDKLLDLYEPSNALAGVMQRTFERVYGEAGLEDTIRLIDGLWTRFSIEDKALIANFYMQAVWDSFNRELRGNTLALVDKDPPFPIVFDAQLPEHLWIEKKEMTDGYFHFVGSAHTPGVIVISQDLATNSSALEAFNVIGHEIAHALIYYMLQNGITPPGCEQDMHWLKSSLLLTHVKGTYDLNPHECMPRWVEQLFGDFFSRHG